MEEFTEFITLMKFQIMSLFSKIRWEQYKSLLVTRLGKCDYICVLIINQNLNIDAQTPSAKDGVAILKQIQ